MTIRPWIPALAFLAVIGLARAAAACPAGFPESCGTLCCQQTCCAPGCCDNPAFPVCCDDGSCSATLDACAASSGGEGGGDGAPYGPSPPRSCEVSAGRMQGSAAFYLLLLPLSLGGLLRRRRST